MQLHKLQDGLESFDVSVWANENNAPVVLFSVGAGGNPERHLSLLEALAKSGCTVIAPHFKRLTSLVPTEEVLTLRARRLQLVIDAFVPSGQSVVGIGHSIGASTLLALSGGQMWLGRNQRVNIAFDERLARLALLAPATGFFQAPHALDAVKIPIFAWAGSKDEITPAKQTEWLAHEMRDWNTVAVRVTQGAGHFSFMDQAPPNSVEPLQDKQEFLYELSNELCTFALS